jgi:glycosyltransferase involved in cell wall biosynthesis
LSVLFQRFNGKLEILVGEDYSTDDTRTVLRELQSEFPERLMVLMREKNFGPFENLRDLAARASGEFIAHLDGDDYWTPGKLTEQIAFLDAHPDCTAVYTNAHVIDAGGILRGGFNNPQPTVFDTDYLLQRGNFLNHSSILYRAAYKDAITDLQQSFIDYRLHLRLSRRGPLGYVNKDLVAYRLGTATSMMSNQSEMVQNLYWEALADPVLADVSNRTRQMAVARGIAQFALSDLVKGRRPRLLGPARARGALEGLNNFAVLASSALTLLRLLMKAVLARIGKFLTSDRLLIFYER